MVIITLMISFLQSLCNMFLQFRSYKDAFANVWSHTPAEFEMEAVFFQLIYH